MVVLCGCLVPASGQITIEITTEQDQFLTGESIPLAVRITNRSGQSLHLGEQADWLTFSVESLEADGGVVPQLSEVAVQGGFDLPTSKTAIKRVNIAPCFELTLPARYSVTASLRIPGWDRIMTSPAKPFYVIEGTRMWEKEVGLPNTGTNGAPETRRYILQQANYVRGQLKLYLRVTDGPGLKIRKVQQVGGILSFSRPEPQVDSDSNLHLMYQSGPGVFTYLLFNPDGEILKRQTYDYINTRPRLKGDDQGRITVIGGVRRITKDDVPAPLPEAPALEQFTNLPPQTITNSTNSTKK